MKKKSKRFLENLWTVLNRSDMAVLPSQLAFNFVLALVPTITLIALFTSIFHISLQDVNTYFNLNLSPAIYNMLKPVAKVREFHFSLIVLLIISIYIASNGMSSMIIAADNIYGIKQKPFVYRKIKGIIIVFIIIFLFVFILLVPIFGNFIISLIENTFGESGFYDVIRVLKYPLTWLVIYIFIKVLYTIAPDKQLSSKFVTKGAIFTSIGWVIATELYLYYVNHFANYALYYSGLSNLAILMIWIYFLSYIFVIGMGINYQEEPYEIEKTKKIEALKTAKKNQNN